MSNIERPGAYWLVAVSKFFTEEGKVDNSKFAYYALQEFQRLCWWSSGGNDNAGTEIPESSGPTSLCP
jgi:hypothetical protein